MRLITRHQIYDWFQAEYTSLPITFVQMLFKTISDADLARIYHLTYLRPGYFY